MCFSEGERERERDMLLDQKAGKKKISILKKE